MYKLQVWAEIPHLGKGEAYRTPVSFVIPNWNRREMLVAALQSIRTQTVQPVEIIVVDNGSTDGSVEAAQQAGANVLELSTNRGFSAAINLGVKQSRTELLVLANNDIEFEPHWTERLLHGLDRSGAWFAIGKLLDTARRDLIDGVGDAVCLGGAACRLGHGHPDHALFDTPRTTFFPSATAVMLRRELFERAGGLEEGFFAYLEDVDLGLRAALLDLPGIYVPDAVAYHRGSATLGVWSSEVVRWLTRNQILLLAKFYPWRTIGRYWRPIAAAQALWAAMVLQHGRPLACARGLLGGLASGVPLRRQSVRWRDSGNRLAAVLAQSQAELLRVQRATGWDKYWRWYFRLAPPPRELNP